jgi:3D (Asp-Asp-Asp) domain-containing protein
MAAASVAQNDRDWFMAQLLNRSTSTAGECSAGMGVCCRPMSLLRTCLAPMLCLCLSTGAFAATTKHKPRKHSHHAQRAQRATQPQQSLVVTATAYNCTLSQTDGDPIIGAWGDHLDAIKPGFRAIAVSPDLADKGLTHNKRVRIQGFKGEFLVLDRTPRQWQNTVDIFMGSDVAAARQFGRKELKVTWSVPAAKAAKSVTTAPTSTASAGN